MNLHVDPFYESVKDKIWHWLANIPTDTLLMNSSTWEAKEQEVSRPLLQRSTQIVTSGSWCFVATDQFGRKVEGHIHYPADVTPNEVYARMQPEYPFVF
jgi:hypothetical protein